MENDLAYSLFKRISAYLEKTGSSITIGLSIDDSYIRVYTKLPHTEVDIKESQYCT